MNVTAATIEEQRRWMRDRAPIVVEVINEVREELGMIFDSDVDTVDEDQYRMAVTTTFDDDDRGVNVAALVGILRSLDVEADYPGFIVDELLGRELAATIAGPQPLRLLAEATFHYADITQQSDADDATAGIDDLDAALAAGYQTRLPGWDWQRADTPF